jgi:hypothetical protein
MPTPRTATVKFDYDASDNNELSVLAKEVEIAAASETKKIWGIV